MDSEKKEILKKYCYDGSRHFSIKDASTNETSLCRDKAEALAQMQKNDAKMDELQAKLYAAKKEGVIFLFQAMDAAGKDGTIRSVLTCLSPHGVHEAAFKSPSSEELAHDFLWRIEKQVPAKGELAIFNRSQYEDVLIAKVRKLYLTQAHADRIDTDTIIQDRYEDIRHFEHYLYRNSIRTVKIFLHVSKDEQALRFLSRIDEPEKNWKFSPGDWQERGYWDAYQEAFEDAINATATKEAPWYVVPADHKWYMRYLVSEILCDTLIDMDPHYPEVTKERLAEFEKLRASIEKDLPEKKLKKVQKEC
jgi:PPK2 family polyphosphate:nucleotide phosphotransferase